MDASSHTLPADPKRKLCQAAANKTSFPRRRGHSIVGGRPPAVVSLSSVFVSVGKRGIFGGPSQAMLCPPTKDPTRQTRTRAGRWERNCKAELVNANSTVIIAVVGGAVVLGGLVEDEVMRLAIEVEEAAAEPPKVRRRSGGREMNGYGMSGDAMG
ncbi:hypothetical protein DHEL01_v211420 [Diaporthe helianthi]|uniref:Uncharacterized protein n=1 Tax=Diaporthe helianthi TaxID=158607 RepID=A0A2P5HIW5_DIAHE|nr:hypothetical protein DHEL01_v211420 [Diaporthe helianthi]